LINHISPSLSLCPRQNLPKQYTLLDKMVQGLAFLSKKSWHVKNMNNQEKVWMAEQRKAHEESKTKELARQIQQERERDEIDAISGKKSSHLDRGIAWMHEGGMGEAAKEDRRKQDEEYLMGKEYLAAGVKGGDFAVDEVKDGVNAVIASAAGAMPTYALPSQSGPTVADKNESFRMRYEDPMFLVSKKHHEQQAKVEKTKALYERVIGRRDVAIEEGHQEGQEAKHAKKDRKKDRKRRHRDDDDGDRNHRHRLRSQDRHDFKEDRKSRKLRKRSRSPSCSDETDRGSSLQHDRPERNNSCGSDSDRRRDFKRDNRISENIPRYSKHWKYGLQGSFCRDRPTHDLGPSRELLAQKRQLREETRHSMRDRASNRNRRSEEERYNALLIMQNDAIQRIDVSRHSSKSDIDNDNGEAQPRSSATFLSDMKQQIHGIQANHTHSLSSRMRENRHRSQNLEASFL